MALRYCTECGEQWDDGNGYRPHTPWQCRENVIDRLRRQLAAANERAGRLEKALKFYADPLKHNLLGEVNEDHGSIARKALEVPDGH